MEDSDPFVWKDKLSADPAVWSEFSAAFTNAYGNSPVSPEQARTFCRDWLEKEAKDHEFYSGPLVVAFDSVATPQDWEDALAEL